MNLHELKLQLQNHLSDGMVLIVGSGLSCAETLPGMGELAAQLDAVLAPKLKPDAAALWQVISAALGTDGLEAALLKHPPSPELETAIAAATGDFIAAREGKVIAEVFNGTRTLRLTRLLKHLLKPNAGLPIVTTNYDRLVELAVEEAGLGVDTMFVGQFMGLLNPKESQLSFCREVSMKKRNPVFTYKQRAIVCKPHGSLDWYLRAGKPIRYGGTLSESTRLIITPGQNKFRNGYDSPFDRHRERANKAIDLASRFLVLGYGFNDDHLETHLKPAIRSGRPTLLLTHSLSKVALNLAHENSNVIALEAAIEHGAPGTRVFHSKKSYFFPNLSLWDINDFITEVLEP